MDTQFKDQAFFRDGSVVEVEVRSKQGLNKKMNEKNALERAAGMIRDRLGALDSGD